MLSVALLTLSACDTLITQEKLRRPTDADSMTLPADVFYTAQADKPVDERYYVGLLGGRYVAEWTDANGTFYRGSGEAVVWADDPNKQIRHVAQGGLYVANRDAQPRLTMYRYLGTEKIQKRRGVPGSPGGTLSAPESAPSPMGTNDVLVSGWNAGSDLGVGIGMGIVAMAIDMDSGKIALQKPPTPVGIFEGKFTRP